jgi:GNAT superfamily N-acetyltransferase
LATAADIPALCELLSILFSQEQEFTPNPQIQSRALQEILENPSIGHIFVARQEGEIIGMVSLLYTISTALGGKVALLEDMIVAPEYRNSGVGSQLLKHAIRFANQTDCQRITLLTDSDNKSAQNFYQRHGFTPSEMVPLRYCVKLGFNQA